MRLSPDFVQNLIDSQAEGLAFLERHDLNEVSPKSEPPAGIIFLDTEAVLQLHEGMGKKDDLRSLALLESALARAEQAAIYADPTMSEMGMLIAEGIIRNHPFVDGNKRTAQLALCAFLALNKEPCPEDSVKTGEILLALSTRRITVYDAAQYLDLCEMNYIERPADNKDMTM